MGNLKFYCQYLRFCDGREGKHDRYECRCGAFKDCYFCPSYACTVFSDCLFRVIVTAFNEEEAAKKINRIINSGGLAAISKLIFLREVE